MAGGLHKFFEHFEAIILVGNSKDQEKLMSICYLHTHAQKNIFGATVDWWPISGHVFWQSKTDLSRYSEVSLPLTIVTDYLFTCL